MCAATFLLRPSSLAERAVGKGHRLDACNLARLHRGGELTPIRVPTDHEEALRGLVRVKMLGDLDAPTDRTTMRSPAAA
jgi:hypothetical protein